MNATDQNADGEEHPLDGSVKRLNYFFEATKTSV